MTVEIGMRAEGAHCLEYDSNFRVAVNKQSVPSINAGYRYLSRSHALHCSCQWTIGLLVLPLMALMSVQFVSVANAAMVGGPPPAESFGAIQLSSCKLSGVPEAARCGVLEVLENPNRPAGRQLKIGVAVIPAIGGQPRPDPIVVLMGGPGEDAIGASEIYAEQFARLRHDRDILLGACPSIPRVAAASAISCGCARRRTQSVI
jgi:hypothetical protein